jgi:hypothetical protein
MPLDVWIFGPGFGESILLMWDVKNQGYGTVRRAAFLDCYGGSNYALHPGLCQWRDAGCPSVALVCITHPHLDHILHASVMMAAAGCLADKAIWWGGQDLRRTRAFFGQMSQDLALKGKELGKTSEATWRFLNDLDSLKKGIHGCRPAGPKPDVLSAMGTDPVHSEQATDGLVQFHAISPWLGPQTEYTKWIDSQVLTTPTGKTEVRPNKGVANCTSLGFLIRYGEAQVLLGGDMEAENWSSFDNARTNGVDKTTIFPLNPCLIKVSHHGSFTGGIDGMWKPGCGFFGSLERGHAAPHCVITPWRMGDRRWHLPNPKVVEKIAQAGCHVWETASTLNVGLIDRSTRPIQSFVHFLVDPDRNEGRMVEEHLCRYTAAQSKPVNGQAQPSQMRGMSDTSPRT